MRLTLAFFMTVSVPLVALGQDGEGTARIVSPGRLVAGTRERVVVEVTVGASGIPMGGGGRTNFLKVHELQTAPPVGRGLPTAQL